MFTVYILRGSGGRHYVAMTNDFERRFAQHRRGHTHTTVRLGGALEVLARRDYPDRASAAQIERLLKRWENPAKAIAYLKTASG